MSDETIIFPDFVAPTDRDAYATIRGYVYQVETTISRWLSLTDGQCLELERGEDIDLISEALRHVEQRDRLLEQVKHRVQPISLRSLSVLEALANAFEHLQTNKHVNLTFRFTTNTQVTKERKSSFPDGHAGITAWNMIRQSRFKEDTRALALKEVRRILTRPCPEDLNTALWNRFQTFITTADDAGLLDFIARFEWGILSPDVSTLAERNVDALACAHCGNDRSRATELHQRLFLYVMRVLCLEGVKRLDGEMLRKELAKSTLTEQDHAQLQCVVQRLTGMEARIAKVEQRVERLEASQQDLWMTARQQFGSRYDIPPANFMNAIPDTSVPDVALHKSVRSDVVRELRATLSSHAWTAIVGPAGVGKTQLATLVSRSISTPAVWIRLRNLNEREARGRIESVLRLFALPTHGETLSSWLERVCQRLQPQSLIVLDDLLLLDGEDAVSEIILHLTKIGMNSGTRILSTSHHELSSKVKSKVGTIRISETPCPALCDAEVKEMLESSGAPADILTPERVSFLNTIGRQHPTLVVAAVEYLQKCSWRFSTKELEELLLAKHTSALATDVLSTFMGRVTDEQSRQLLYRLNIVGSQFSAENAIALAQVNPPIDRPRERLQALMGFCVQAEQAGRMRVSPLFVLLGDTDVPAEVRTGCHLVMAHQILTKRSLNQYDAVRAILHFSNAGEVNKAGLLLMDALNAISTLETAVDDAGLLWLWNDMPLPNSMDLGIRIVLRGTQIRAACGRDKNTDDLVADLNRLIAEASDDDAYAVFAAALQVHIAVATERPQQGNAYLTIALRAADKGLSFKGTAITLPNSLPPLESLVWGTAFGIKTVEDLDDWVATIDGFTAGQRQQALTCDLAEDGSFVVSNRLWMVESTKPTDQQRWDIVSAAIERLGEKAKAWGGEFLWSCAVHGQMATWAEKECRNSLAGALTVAEKALDVASEDARVQFVIRQYVGRQLFYARRNDEAARWLSMALSYPTTCLPVVRKDAVICASVSIGDSAKAEAAEYARQAVSLCESMDDLPATEHVRMLGELSIAIWLESGPAAAAVYMCKAADLLLANRSDDTEWRDTFVLYGHTLGYFARLASTGQPPAGIAEGEEYAKPFRGVFLSHMPKRAELHTERRESLLYALVAEYLYAVGEEDLAATWTDQGMRAALAQNHHDIAAEIRWQSCCDMLLQNRLGEALAVARQFSAMVVAAVEADRQGMDWFESVQDVEAILGPKSSDLRRRADDNAMACGVLPVGLRIAQLRVDSGKCPRSYCEEVADACRQAAASAAVPQKWMSAASVFASAGDETIPIKEAIKAGELLNDTDPSLSALASLLVTIRTDCLPDTAVRLHLRYVPYTLRLLRVMRRMEVRILAPYLYRYWSVQLDSASFRFRSPALVRAGLKQCEGMHGAEQIKKVLEVISGGLGIPMVQQMRDWLKS